MVKRGHITVADFSGDAPALNPSKGEEYPRIRLVRSRPVRKAERVLYYVQLTHNSAWQPMAKGGDA